MKNIYWWLILILIYGNAGAFSIVPDHIINKLGLNIVMDARESAFFNDGRRPFVKIGNSYSECYPIQNLNTWYCNIPDGVPIGEQQIHLLASRIGPVISKASAIFGAKEISVIILNDLGKIGAAKSATISHVDPPFDIWAASLIGESGDLVKKNLYAADFDGDDALSRSDVYIPKSAQLFASQNEDEKSSIPRACTSGMTIISEPKSHITLKMLLSSQEDSSLAVVPTREPTVGDSSLESDFQTVYSADEASVMNDIIIKSFGLPEDMRDKFLTQYRIDKNNDSMSRFDVPTSDYYEPIKSKIIILDTFDSETGIDNFNLENRLYHGKVVYNIIKSIVGESADVVARDVCKTANGVCDTRYIIDEICQAIYEAGERSIIINMSLSGSFGGRDLFEVIKYASGVGIIFVVSSGNTDKCSDDPSKSLCRQYPADWIGKINGLALGGIISVGSVEPSYGKDSLRYDKFSDFDIKSANNPDNLNYASIYAPGEYYMMDRGIAAIKRKGTSFSVPYVSGVLALWQYISGEKMPCRIGEVDVNLGVMVLRFPSGSRGLNC